jgi:DNA-binding response OmpR family regulator
VEQISILVIDDDEPSQSALRQVLDSEGWQVRVVAHLNRALSELSSGGWALVIANIAMTGLDGPVFLTLRELAIAPGSEENSIRVRVLFLLPELTDSSTRLVLEKDRLPYVVKPFQFHDFLEKVSDLLMETGALKAPIRRVRHDTSATERQRNERRQGRESGLRQTVRDTGMFANRDSYVMTEEEISEYEKSEQEQQEKKRKKPPANY